MPSTWRTENWEMMADEEDRSSSEWEKISVPNASRASSPSNMEVNPFELEGIISRLERELTEAQQRMEEQRASLDALTSDRNHLLGTCENLRLRLDGKTGEAMRLSDELTKCRELYARTSLNERRIGLELKKETNELSEDVYMSKNLFSAVSGGRRPTHLEEPWIFEESVLSMLIRAEVRKTIISVQKDCSVIMEVKSLSAPIGVITATCSLHDCVGFLYKMNNEEGDRWRGDRSCLKLHFGVLYVNYGHKAPLGKSLEDALLNGTTTETTIHNICGGKRLRRQLEAIAGRS